MEKLERKELRKKIMDFRKELGLTNDKNHKGEFVISDNVYEFEQRDILSQDEIEKRINTDEIIKQIKEYIEKIEKSGEDNNVDFNAVKLVCTRGLIFKRDYWDMIEECFEDPELGGGEGAGELINVIELDDTLNNIIPVKFYLEWTEVYTNDATITDDMYSLLDGRIEGIVEYDKFIKKINELGYKVYFDLNDTHEASYDYNDYVEEIATQKSENYDRPYVGIPGVFSVYSKHKKLDKTDNKVR